MTDEEFALVDRKFHEWMARDYKQIDVGRYMLMHSAFLAGVRLVEAHTPDEFRPPSVPKNWGTQGA